MGRERERERGWGEREGEQREGGAERGGSRERGEQREGEAERGGSRERGKLTVMIATVAPSCKVTPLVTLVSVTV